MKICLVGKFPPIEGGVSASTFWLAHGLARKGHHVYVVTNAMEVEDEYRIHLGPHDLAAREPSFPETGGFIRVFDTEPLSDRTTHIPAHNPFLTKLASMATQVIREFGCEVIFAHYFEPYGLAAHLASSWTGVPFVLRHAGSDLDRLMRQPQLSTAYKEAARRADVLVTSSRLADRFLGMGLDPERIYSAEGYSPPPDFFNPAAEPLDLASLAPVYQPFADGRPIPLDLAKPTIGIYGKVGVFKGSFDLIRALEILRREGLEFNFVAMTQGRSFASFEKVLRHSAIAGNSWVFPFQPNWRIPSFIRSCSALCFLERDFPIKIHTPTIAFEILKSGGCLVLSGEIAAKQQCRDRFADGENVLLVADPKRHDELASQLRKVIQDQALARRIGAAGVELAEDRGANGRFVDSWEQLIFRAAGRPSTATSLAERTRELVELGIGRLSEVLTPRWTGRLLGERLTGELEEFTRERTAIGQRLCSPREIADAFTEHLRRRFQAGALEIDGDLAEACFAYDAARREANRDPQSFFRERGDRRSEDLAPGGARALAFAHPDSLLGSEMAEALQRQLKPLKSSHLDVLSLPLDVTPLFTAPSASPAEVERKPVTIVFHRTPNLMACELRVSPPAARLLQLCDGERGIGEIAEELAAGRPATGNHGKASAELLASLQSFYDHRIIVFRA